MIQILIHKAMFTIECHSQELWPKLMIGIVSLHDDTRRRRTKPQRVRPISECSVCSERRPRRQVPPRSSRDGQHDHRQVAQWRVPSPTTAGYDGGPVVSPLLGRDLTTGYVYASCHRRDRACCCCGHAHGWTGSRRHGGTHVTGTWSHPDCNVGWSAGGFHFSNGSFGLLFFLRSRTDFLSPIFFLLRVC